MLSFLIFYMMGYGLGTVCVIVDYFVKLKWEIFIRRVMLYGGEIECWVVRKQRVCKMSIVETRI